MGLLEQPLRRVTLRYTMELHHYIGWAGGLAVALAVACGPAPETWDPDPHAEELASGRKFVDDREFRRSTLEDSLVDRDNGYARLRLDNYGTPEGGWESLEVWNPPVRPVTTDDIGAFSEQPYRKSSGDFAPVLSDSDPDDVWSHDTLMALGRRAFHTYPLQVDMQTGRTVESRRTLRRYGLWIDSKDRVGGLVRVRLPGGREGFSKTCATCHASPASKSDADGPAPVVAGRANADFDRGAILAGGHRDTPAADWGPGQIDVTPDGRPNPAAIPDLRPVRHQTHLHWAATLRNSLASLAVRTDTLIITSLNEQLRPPRVVSFALAYYIWHLGDGRTASAHKKTAPPTGLADRELEGADIFDQTCSRCHHADGTTAPPVALERVGTDPAVGRSPMRGTGRYRIPSLAGVADRSQYLHTGSVSTLEALFDPDRLDQEPGHRWGTRLPDDERRALVAYLRTL